MKRKIFTLLLSAMVVLSAFAQKPTELIKKASADPVIDGVVDAVWSEATRINIVKGMTRYTDGVETGTDVVTLGAEGETTWQALWSDNGIYVLVIVNDDDFYPSYILGQSNNWEWDKVELYFDCNYILDDVLGPQFNQGHYQVAPAFSATNIAGTPVTESRGEKYAFMVNDPDYVAEYFVPFSVLKDKDGVSVDRTGNIGFDVMISDRDEATDDQERCAWANDGSAAANTENWNNMDNAGIITLDGADMILIDFDGITLTGGTIAEDNGTLQVGVAITPTNATNQVLDWSVENGTGKARVDANGLVTAIADGDVTIWAKATDGSYEEASCVVTISGQTTTLWELNILRNGGLDELNEDGKAVYWGGWTDASPGYTMQDGVSVHTPLLTDNVWQYQFSQEGFDAEADVDHIFRFKAWAANARTFTCDFEDIGANGNNRYGETNDPRSADGQSEWTFDITTEPTWYTFDVKFTEMVETTVQKVIFMLGHSAEVTYIDSILLVTAADYGMTSVPNSFSESAVRLYPNPIDGSNMLTIDRLPADARITIFDSLGRKVTEVVATKDRADFNVSSYARGVYFVKVNNDSVMKFIK